MKPLANIQAFDPLCEVQSDKASVEITSPFDGVIKELLVKEGEVAKVGAGLCLIEVDEEVLAGTDPVAVEPVDAPALPPPSPAEVASEPPSGQTVTEPSKRGLHPLDPNYAPGTNNTQGKDVLAPPSVRHFARQSGVNLLNLVPGSGKDGRIEKRDVEAYLSKGTAASTQADVPAPKVETGKDVVVELGRTRHGMWKAMVKVSFLSCLSRHLLSLYIEFGNPSFRVSYNLIFSCPRYLTRSQVLNHPGSHRFT